MACIKKSERPREVKDIKKTVLCSENAVVKYQKVNSNRVCVVRRCN